jgi:branched-chain amino acid transport system substrate-binding protein
VLHRLSFFDMIRAGFRDKAWVVASLLCCFVLSGCVASSRLGGAIMNPDVAAPAAKQDGKMADETLGPDSTKDATIATTDLAPPSGSDAYATQKAQAPAKPVTANGTLHVSLLLPLSASGATGKVAQAMKNAADMAVADLQGAKIDLVVKDEKGTIEGARAAAKEALSEDSSVIIGPLLAPSVQTVGAIVRGSGRPVFAFSTDTGVAGRGIYLLSFLPQSDVERIMSYAASKGKKSIAALVPDNAYGTTANAALQVSAARNGVKIVAIERYTNGAVDDAARKIAAIRDQIDALFIPDSGDEAVAIGQALAKAGLDSKKIQVIGTSIWDDSRIYAAPWFQNGWFALPDQSGFTSFSNRYQTQYGEPPARIATLAYDAVLLVNALRKKAADHTFDDSTITAPDGVIGIDGLFRLRADGTNQRGLAIMQVTKDGPKKIDAAPTAFNGD